MVARHRRETDRRIAWGTPGVDGTPAPVVPAANPLNLPNLLATLAVQSTASRSNVRSSDRPSATGGARLPRRARQRNAVGTVSRIPAACDDEPNAGCGTAEHRTQGRRLAKRAGVGPGFWSLCGTLSGIASFAACGWPGSEPLTPRQALESFRVADGFRVELFAAEPHVVDPVEMAFDENGGVYVAELLDNPYDPPEGEPPLSRIKYLEDTDGDGIVDRHTVFADRVLGVEGIAPWKGGLIATAAPDILYLKDTDGDHQADVRERLYTGFALANVEVRVSNPRLGLDNWFYVANHGTPGTITPPARPNDDAVNIRNREFRFHPLRNLAEPATGDAQFGHDSNEWGHWFIAHNTVHLRHTVIPSGYLGRNPFLSVESTTQDISDHGRPAATLFPISQPQQWRVDRTEARQRRYAETRPDRQERLAGFFTAACGSTVYIGDASTATCCRGTGRPIPPRGGHRTPSSWRRPTTGSSRSTSPTRRTATST